jgi:hypothetical protein
MPKRTTAESAWRKRVASPAFQRRLRRVLARELGALGALRVKDLISATAVRRRLRAWTTETLASDAFADLLIAGNRRLERRLRQQQRSLRDMLGAGIGGDVELLLDSLPSLPPSTQDPRSP